MGKHFGVNLHFPLSLSCSQCEEEQSARVHALMHFTYGETQGQAVHLTLCSLSYISEHCRFTLKFFPNVETHNEVRMLSPELKAMT